MSVFISAQSIKGPEKISYFQAPADGLKFTAADVYLRNDDVLEKVKLEEAKNNPLGMGININLGGDVEKMADRIANLLKGEQDKEGRFDKWHFIPQYIIAKPETKKNVIVEIFFLNEQDPAPSTSFMNEPKADKDGYYSIHYYINCRYRVSTQSGDILFEKNLGVLSGDAKSLTPPPAPPKMGEVVVSNEKFDIAEKIGINIAVNRVRQDVFAHFGFGQFSSPIKLGVIKEIKESKKLINPTISVFENKKGLLLSEDDKNQVRKLVNIIEKNIDKTSDKTRWVAYHNLSVCYAWLEEPQKAKEAYKKYGEEIAETLDEYRRWDLLLAGKLPKEERKGLVIGAKDRKKFENYRDIETFVNYYPEGVKRYQKLFTVINRDLKKFVDFYAHNDLLCQLYEIDFPYQFFPLQDFNGSPKSVKGSITKEGMEPIEFNIKFDSKRMIKELSTSQVSKLETGGKEKLISRDLQPIFNDKSGRYIMMSDPNKRGVLAGNDVTKSDLKKIEEPLSEATYCFVNNITKKTGFFGDKKSNETVQLKVDLDGNIFYDGKSNYFKMNAIFKDILSSNGIEAKRSDTYTKFSTQANINDKGVMDFWSWDGDVKTNFASFFSEREQELHANKMLREIEFISTDEHGNPTKMKYKFTMKGKVKVEQKMNIKEWFEKSYEQGHVPTGDITSEGFNISYEGEWDCNFIYDNNGNWTEMQIGPYKATRTFKY